MTSLSPSQENNQAVRLLFEGKITEAKVLFREAIANTKHILDYSEYITSDTPRAGPPAKFCAILIPNKLTDDQSRQDSCAIPMFNKVFLTPEHLGPEDLDLVAASIFYNLAVACSIGKNDSAAFKIEHKLYSLSIEMINSSGYFHDPSCSLLLMALCNNTAQSSFCDGRVDEARVALHELLHLLECRPGDSIQEEDRKFFYLNTLLVRESYQIQTICSPSA